MAAMCSKVVNVTVLQQLECSMCKYTCGAEIHACSRGHLVCSRCMPLKRCPTCDVEGPLTRRPSLEKISVTVDRPCENAPHGCTVMLNIAEMAKHWESCEGVYSYHCKISHRSCSWRGKHPQDLVHHVTTEHPGHYAEGESVQMDWSCQKTLVSAFEELFWVYCIYQPDGLCYLSTFWINPGEEEEEGKNTRFGCKFTYYSADGTIQHVTTVPAWSINSKLGNSLILTREQLEAIVRGGKYSFVAKIFKRYN